MSVCWVNKVSQSSIASILVVVAIVIMGLGVKSANAAGSCQTVFPGAVQNHSDTGAITLLYASKIQGQSVNELVTRQLNPSSENNHCNGVACTSSNSTSSVIDVAQFSVALSGGDVSVPYLGEQVIGVDWYNEFNRVEVGSSAKLSFSSDISTYVINTLVVGYGATLNLTPGDYWVGKLDIGANSQVNVVGDGVVRLFVKDTMNAANDARINPVVSSETDRSQRLFIYVGNDVNFYNYVSLNGVLYGNGSISLGHTNSVNGAVSARDLYMDYKATVTYDPLAVAREEFETVCQFGAQINDLDGDGTPDDIDLDRDGDGISNYYEQFVGTDADNASEVPADVNANGIPDSVELGSGENQCLAAFTNGLQSHAAVSEIKFDKNAQLLGSNNPYLSSNSIVTDPISTVLNCDVSSCVETDIPVTKLNPGEFKTISSTIDIVLPYYEVKILDGTTNQYNKIHVTQSAQLEIQNPGEFYITSMILDWDSELVLEAGDYWVESLVMGGKSRIKVQGEGTVRLFINNPSVTEWNAQINVDESSAGANAAKLFVFSYSNITFKADIHFEGFMYAVDFINLGQTSQAYGAITAGNNIHLYAESKVHYQRALVEQTDFGMVCDIDNDGVYDGLDDDRDGDGISNDYEVQAGTNPDDVNSVPVDTDSDGIPNVLDDDRDGDGVNNTSDAFPDDATETADLDNDGIGDNADTDRDGDGISNDYETQLGFNPNDATNTPPDLDEDGIPDSLDTDRDGDGVANTADKFPDDATESTDLDNDGIGDNADTDRDGDGISNDYEVQVGTDPNNSLSTPPDLDADGIPDSLDTDRDGDGVDNTTDKFPDDATETADLDNDGIGDNADTDRDGDGISNDYETQLGFNPNDATNTPPDLDSDGIPNSLDDDRDGDGVANSTDKFPDDATESTDLDNDGIGDNADTDRDGDGISNDYEVQVGTDPNNSASTPPDLDADGIPDALDTDIDGDGVENINDAFPNDNTESADLDGDGIGDNTDLDIDGDGVDNLIDLFPLDATESADLDNDGIGDNSDPDTDGDGVNNDVDALPNNPNETSDIDGDGIGDNADTDRDGDGISNSYEEQIGTDPNNASSVPADLDADGIPDSLDNDRDGDTVNNDQDTYPDDNSRSKLPVVTNIQASLQINTAQVQWAALSNEPVAGYNVYRNTTVNTNWLKLNSTSITSNSYADNNLIAGASYRYRVIAIDNNAIEGEGATPVNLFAAFNTVAVENFTLSLQNTAAQLNWLAVNGLQYQIYRGVNSAAPTAFVITTTNQYTDSTIVNVQTASYQVATLAEYTNGFTGETVQIAGPRSQVETVIPLADLTASIVNASIAADGIAELAAGKNNLAHAMGGYQNAVGEVTITATANINNKPVTINQLSNNGQFDLELPANVVTIWLITIKDNAIQNRQVATQLRVLTDTTAPSITLDGGNSRTVNAEQIILNGVVADSGSGIKMLTVQNDRYSGITFTASITDDRFVIEVPLKTGVNGLTLVATDNAANQSQASISVNREIAAAPRIEIISPQSATVTQNQQLNINGIIYSSQPSTDLRVEFNSQQIFPSAGTLEGTHTFSFNNVLLQSGINILSVRVDSPLGSDVTQTQVSYQTASSNEVDAVPIILMASPNNFLVTPENQISVVGSATSSKGVASVSVNGEQIVLGGATQTSLSFNTLIDMSLQAEGEVAINVIATDAEGASTTQTLTVIKDTQSPQIILSDASLQAEPAVNTVNANPYLLSGTVSDANIASLSINNQSVNLLPGISANQYTFEAALTLPAAENQLLNIVARDQAGLQTQQGLILYADVSVGIKFIAPLENEALLIAGDSTTLEVTAQFTDWLEGYQALITHQQDAAQTMNVNGAVAQASLTIPNTEGRHSISIKVQDASGKLLAEATTFVNVTNAAQIPLQVSNSDPANQQMGVEPHLPISVYFNRPINRSLIEVNVYETFTGETYDLDALEGKSALENQEIKFKQVDRNYQAVLGGLAFYPEDTLVSFYPSREFSYGATVYVDVIYDGTVLAKQSYKVRALPTFLQGSIMNNFNEPLQQIRVSIPALNREVLSDNQGNYGFGYGDTAQNTLPAGRYKMIFNPGLVNRHYGTLERWVIIEAGRVSKLPLAQLTFINANTPFERINSGEPASLHGGDLQVDFSNATVYFPDGRKQGDINVQMLELGGLSYSALPSAIPHWMYSIQPMGIAVNGTVNLAFTMPTLNGEYNYLPAEGSYVVLLGFNNQSELFEPIGAGMIENRRVLSTQAIELADLSYLGYALVVPDNAAILKDYAEGNISLNALKSALSQ